MLPFPNLLLKGITAVNATSSQWRINISAVQSAGNWANISHIEMAATVGGTNLCSGGTATASSDDGSNVAANAFGGTVGAAWFSGTGTMPQWIAYQFASAVTIGEVRLRGPNSQPNDGIKNFTIEYFDGSAWQVAKTVANEIWAGASTAANTKSFPIGSITSLSETWRLLGVTVQNPGNFVRAAEIELRATSGGADQTGSGTGRASTTNSTNSALNAFDNNTGTFWEAGDGTAGNYILYEFTSPVDVKEVSYLNGSVANDSWSAFKVQRHNSEDWIDVWSVSGQTWAANETKIFTKP